MPLGIPQSARGPVLPRGEDAPPPPAPGFLEGVSTTFRAAQADNPGRTERERLERAVPLVDALGEMGFDRRRYLNPRRAVSGGQYDYDAIFADIGRLTPQQRAKLGVPETRDAWEQQWLGEWRKRIERDEAISSRAGWAPWLIGSFGAGLTDPITLFTIGVGGVGRTAFRRILTEGLAQGAIEGSEQPLINIERAAQGRPELSSGDMATNVAIGAALGSTLRGAAEAAPAIGRAAGRGVERARDPVERAIAGVFDRLPESLQQRWAARASIVDTPAEDVLLADIAEAVIGPENLSEVEQGAVLALRRDAQWQAGSPFLPDGAGQAAHEGLRSDALASIVSDLPPSPAPPTSPSPRAFVPDAPAAARGRTAISTGTVAGDSIENYMRLTRAAESAGDDTAAARTSSAFGRYQFTRGTWLAYYKRRFGTGGLSDDAILAKRADGRMQDVLMRDLTEDNAAMLARIGARATPGNLYLAHFAGPGDARKLLQADPTTPVERVMRADSIRANGFLRGKTAGEVIAWADRKMGGNGAVVRASSGPTVRADIDADEGARLRAEIAAIEDENARLLAELGDDAPPEIDIGEAEPGRIDVDDGEIGAIRAELGGETPEPPEPRAFDPDAPEAEVLALLPRLRELTDNRRRSLNDLARIADELGATEQDVRRGLTALVREGRIAMRRDNGNFMRKPPPQEGPEDVLEFIARKGGIRDDEGHALGLKRESGRTGGQRDWQRMTRRHGKLLRRKGRSIDEVGELLWEAGYLRGRDSERPTVREVLDFIDARIMDGQPRLPIGEAPAPQVEGVDPSRPPVGTNSPDPKVFAASYDIASTLERQGFAPDEIDEELIDAAARLALRYPDELTPWDAYLRSLNEIADEARWMEFEATGESGYMEVDYEWPFDDPQPRYEDLPDAEDLYNEFRSRESAEGGAGVEGDAGGQARAGPDLADLPPEETTRFLDPDGAEARAQLDSLEHDARMAIDGDGQTDFAAPTQEQRRIALERQTEGRKKGTAAQKPPGSDGGLFDLGDGGQPRTMRDMLDGFDDEASELNAARDCLKPGGGAEGAE